MNNLKNRHSYNHYDEYSYTILIRAHHLLCIQGFQGLGYSEEFVENMTQLTDHLKTKPYTNLKIINEVDDICLYCPHQKNKSCAESDSSDQRIKSMDLKVLDYLGLQEKEIHSYEYLLKLLHQNIDFPKLKDICGSCSWTKNCIFYNTLNKNK